MDHARVSANQEDMRAGAGLAAGYQSRSLCTLNMA